MPDDKDATKRRIIQLLQSRCRHTRFEFIARADVFLCLDCGKIIYKKEEKHGD